MVYSCFFKSFSVHVCASVDRCAQTQRALHHSPVPPRLLPALDFWGLDKSAFLTLRKFFPAPQKPSSLGGFAFQLVFSCKLRRERPSWRKRGFAQVSVGRVGLWVQALLFLKLACKRRPLAPASFGPWAGCVWGCVPDTLCSQSVA